MSASADALDSLVNSEGWKLFKTHAAAEWSPGSCWRKVKEGGDLEKVDYTNVEVGKLMTWPETELARLRRLEQAKEPTLSRRGGL